MSEVTDKSLQELNTDGADLGNFYPTHHIMIAFEHKQQAEQAAEVLKKEGGFSDCRYFSDQQVAAATQRGLETANVVAAMGASLKMVELQNQLAREGCHFLLVKAPGDEGTEKVMNILRRGPFRLALKYHRLVIETLH